MVRAVFFTIHFIGGFFLLWLVYTLASIRLLPADTPLELKGGLETAYLVSGVIWGNLGWDNFKRIPNNANFSLFAYVLSRTLAPVAIGLPIVILALDMFFEGTIGYWRPVLTWQNLTLICIDIAVIVNLFVYKKSANASHYSVLHAKNLDLERHAVSKLSTRPLPSALGTMKSPHNSKSIIATIVALFLLAAMSTGLYFAIKSTYRILSDMDSDIAVAIIAAAATAFVSVISIIVGKIYEARTAVQEELRKRKTPVYEEFITFIFRVLLGEKTKSPPTEDEVAKFLSDYNQKMMVWASDSVLREWTTWRRSLEQHGNSTANDLAPGLIQYERLILAIRKDLGHKNSGIKKFDILRLFINDLDKTIDGRNDS